MLNLLDLLGYRCFCKCFALQTVTINWDNSYEFRVIHLVVCEKERELNSRCSERLTMLCYLFDFCTVHDAKRFILVDCLRSCTIDSRPVIL